MIALEKELATYNQKLPEFKGSEGKFVVIHGDDVLGIYSTYDDAIKEGYSKLGLKPFLVKQVNTLEQIQFISRFAAPCSLSAH